MDREERKPRILINALSMGLGGGRSNIINLLRELGRDDRGFSFRLLVLQGQLDGVDTHGVPIEEVRLPFDAGRFRAISRGLYEQLALPIRSRHDDLVFCVADLCPILNRTPVVVMMQNLNIYDRTWAGGGRTRILAALARWGAFKARVAVFPSQAAADQISRVVGLSEDRIAVVHHGIDPEAFAPEAGGTEGADERGFLFLPAAPERHKNIATLIRALALLPEERLVIVGSSSLQPEHAAAMQDLAHELDVADRVEFRGAVPYRDVMGLYRRAKALVFPSHHETFGLPLLEAMLAGIPIVASDLSVFRELAEGIALFHPVEDAAALAACVRQLEADPEATKRRVAAGRERADEFSWRRSTDELCEVFRVALAAD